MTISVNEVQFLNAICLIDVTDDGIDICFNDWHPHAKLGSIDVIEERIEIVSNDVQL